MASFATIIDITLEYEGGDLYTNNPHDPGGETRYGISKQAFPEVNIESLTREHAKELYLKHYWTPIHGDSFMSQHVANQVFDFAVNAGVSTAAKTLQEAINSIRPEEAPRLVVDGLIGPVTLAAMNRMCEEYEDVLWTAYVARRARFYMKLNKKRFIRGWLRRIGITWAT